MTKETKRQKNWATGKMEWDMFYQGRYIGSASTKAAAEARLDLVAYEAAKRGA